MPFRTDEAIIDRSDNIDENEKAIFARELEYIKRKTYDRKYPEYKATMLMPISTEAGPGAKTITYRQFDMVGFSKILANYADDLPRVDVFGKEFTSPVRPHGNAYGYNIDEIAESAMAGRPLKSMKATASRTAYEQFINKGAWFARPEDDEWFGLTGLIYNANIPKATAHTGATSGKIKWSEKTALEREKDVLDTVNGITTDSQGIEIPDTVTLPIAQYSLLATAPRSTTGDTNNTSLKFLKEVLPQITKWEWVNELADVDPLPSGNTPTVSPAGSNDIMIVYKNSDEKFTLEIPKPYTQLPVQERNLEFVVNTHAKFGGVIVYYPLAFKILEEI